MALSEDCEAVRMALGAGWDDAHAARVMLDYLRPFVGDDDADLAALQQDVEALSRYC